MQRHQSTKPRLARSAAIALLLSAVLLGSMGLECDSLAFRATFANSLVENDFVAPGLSFAEGIVAALWADDIADYYLDTGGGSSGDSGGE